MNKKKPSIILAEDDAFLAKALMETILEHGAVVHLCKNGEEVLKSIDQAMPDLLLLDLLMPKMDGFTTMEKMKEKGIHIPFIVLSNLNDDTNTERCKKLGALGFFVKSDLGQEEIWPVVEKYLFT